ncbi:MAG TPA: amidohydrolase family protein [Micromonosporaceae bacterium]|jgi:imidazolonepropionase-like amidohydrolase
MTVATSTGRSRLTAIRAARLFDGIDAGLLPDPTVVLDGPTIASIGSGAPVPEGATVVDLRDATLLPGLVDGHVHLGFDSSSDPVANLANRDDAEAFAAMIAAARTAARGGVTTVRDLGDRRYLSLGVKLAAATDPTLPDVLAAGPPITIPGGHCHFLGAEASGIDGLRRAVRDHVDRGVDIIKVMASGGNLTPGSRPHQPQYGVVELRAIVDEAHRHHLPVTAHAHALKSIVDGLAAGLDGFEHLSFMSADGVDPIPDDVLAALVRQRVTVGMTLGFAPVPGAQPPPGILARLPALQANGRRLCAAGVHVIPGSDAGIAPAKPPDAARWAVAQFQDLGMTAAQALHTCTARAATALGLGHRKGQLRPGYDADILAVTGDPTTDPAAIHQIRAVYVRGTPLIR